MRLIFPLVILSLLAVSCGRNTSQEKGEIVASVRNKYLTRQEMEEGIPKSVSPADSVIFADKIIRHWIKDNLLYDIASRNISDKERIDQLVENYRRAVVIYQYQEQLVNEKFSRDISDEEVKRYYDANSDKFKLDQTLVKGLFLKVPVDAPQINNVREWYKSSSETVLGKLEKYTVQNAVKYDYFFDNWVIFNELMDNMPVHYNDPDAVVRSNRNIELQDSSYYYFLSIKQCLLQGDKAPFEYAKPTVREILINQRRVNFLKTVEDDLYNKAIEKGQVKFYTE